MAVHDGNADRSAAALPPVVPAAPRAVVKSATREPTHVSAKTSLPTVVLSDETHAAPRHTRRLLIATVASGVVHATVLVLLGLWWLELPELSKLTELVATIEPREPERPITLDKPRDESPPPSLMPAARDPFVSNLPVTTEIEPPRIEQVGSITQQTTVTIEVPSDIGVKGKAGDDGGLAGLRSGAGRAAAGSARGATPESEEAVELALKWLVRHQQPDGTWNIDHRTKPCKGECDHPGTLVQGRVAATSLALLPFLGAGYTHRTGPYRKEVSRGLKFLERIVEKEGHAVELSGGGMYAHALATIVLCEAYGITGDRVLLRQAQRAIHFIPSAQDPVGGGWRYVPNQPGDTSVVGWQLMALKSGHISYIRVSNETVAAATRFLDSVQLKGGFQYGYLPGYPEARNSTTAIGLLCRMLMGWQRDNEQLIAGVQHLSVLGPSKTDNYYNYYATQVLHNFEGPMWTRWNEVMRDQLVRAQIKRGHAAGSWYVQGGQDDHQAVGGRLYCTALAAMSLEVYYRYLPLYQTGKAEEEKK